jgi:hypothetical protein
LLLLDFWTSKICSFESGPKSFELRGFFADLPLHWHEAGMLLDNRVFSGPKNGVTVLHELLLHSKNNLYKDIQLKN